MRRVLLVVLTSAALVAAFSWGLDRGITLGIEEYSRYQPVVIHVPCPTPAPPNTWSS